MTKGVLETSALPSFPTGLTGYQCLDDVLQVVLGNKKAKPWLGAIKEPQSG